MAYISCISCNRDNEHTNMGTITVGEMSSDSSSGPYEYNSGRYSVRYQVLMASNAGPQSIIYSAQGAGLPALWSTYSYNTTGVNYDVDIHSYARSYTIERSSKTQYLYYVTVNYEPAKEGEISDPSISTTPILATINPLNRKPVIWWDREVYTHLATKDKDGKAIVNPLRTLYDDQIEQERNRAVMVVEWNVQTSYSLVDLTREWDQAVNAGNWNLKFGSTARNVEPRAALIREISAGRVRTEGSYNYYTVRMRIAFADAGKNWDETMPQLARHYFSKSGGAFEVDPATGYYKRNEAADLVPVNDDGTKRADDQEILVKSWQVRREKDFSTLPFMALMV